MKNAFEAATSHTPGHATAIPCSTDQNFRKSVGGPLVDFDFRNRLTLVDPELDGARHVGKVYVDGTTRRRFAESFCLGAGRRRGRVPLEGDRGPGGVLFVSRGVGHGALPLVEHLHPGEYHRRERDRRVRSGLRRANERLESPARRKLDYGRRPYALC
ncbi:hypothetical protein EVAR_44674_1 [Eumeta japonica]|uniref:Uncharacterized protein n=1 Tax=Eumeta variegata TaxID=151549 RepID=A0A4C1Y286_EUMVA|nr:hypothetical protein EVAR_44674_1 [Eumeta japonica]